MYNHVYRLATKIGFTFPHLPKRWNYKKNEMELLATLFSLFYDTYSLLNIEIQNFKLTVTLTIDKNSDNCTKY
jgi:hypothetical protein